MNVSFKNRIINNLEMLVSFPMALRITFLLFFFSSGRHRTSLILSSSYTSLILASSMGLRSCSWIGRAFWEYLPLCPRTAMNRALRGIKRWRCLIEATRPCELFRFIPIFPIVPKTYPDVPKNHVN